MAPILNALLPRWIKKGRAEEAGSRERDRKTYQSHRSERAELVREVRGAHHTSKHASHKGGDYVTEQDERRKKAEQHLTEELANQARQEPGSAAEDEAKEKRAQAEKELQDAS